MNSSLPWEAHMSPALETKGLSVSFGGVHALVDVELAVPEGTLVGLIGPNGAGKTTFIDAISGFVGCRGSINLGGTDITRARPHERADMGLARTWQSIELFDDLTVEENLEVVARPPSLWSTVKEVVGRSAAATSTAADVLARVGLLDVADAMPSELSQGQRKLVGVARALASEPQLVCMDEPAAGLDTSESEALGRQLRSSVNDSMAMLLVDHDMGLVLGVSDYVYVLEFGKVIAHGKPDAVRNDPAVIEAYLGSGGAKQIQEETS
jgi:branched-chain amino acid transport system ATP-binding protein